MGINLKCIYHRLRQEGIDVTIQSLPKIITVYMSKIVDDLLEENDELIGRII